MNHISVFLNNRTVSESESFSASNRTLAFGDWCLTPVRCLFDGNKVTVTTNKDSFSIVDHEKEYAAWNKPNFLRVVASIVLIIPGVILGSLFKGLGHLSQSIRERHKLAILHYTPYDILDIGSTVKRLNLQEIIQQLSEIKNNNRLNQPVKNLVIYAQEGTEINEDPGFMAFNPQKIILVGARIVHASSSFGCLDDKLSENSEWESRKARRATTGALGEPVEESFTLQWKMDSVAAALKDTPPKISLFSSKRYNQVYIV